MDFSKESIASVIRLTRIANSCHPDNGSDSFLEKSIITIATQCIILEDGVLQEIK
jgi:hypothetical protein